MNLRFDSSSVNLKAVGPVTYSTENLSEKALLQKLRMLGITIDKDTLAKLGENAVSLSSVLDSINACVDSQVLESKESEWIFGVICELWRRWFPDKLNFELLQDRLEAIDSLLKQDKISAAARVLFKTWPTFLKFFDDFDIVSAAEFRRLHRVEAELIDNLWATIEQTADVGGPEHFLADRILLCEAVLSRLSSSGESDVAMDGIRFVLAQGYMTLGCFEKVDDLYLRCLENDVCQFECWLNWASCYRLSGVPEHSVRAVQILQNGLAALDSVPGTFSPELQDGKQSLQVVLSHYLESQGRLSELEAVRLRLAEFPDERESRADEASARMEAWTQTEEGKKFQDVLQRVIMAGPVIFPSSKIGRSTPCPCRSGYKFKRCCGRFD